MRLRCGLILAVLALASFDAAGEVRRNGWSRGAFPARVQLRGAVYELRLRLPEPALQMYVAQYARWFLPVDQQQDSGRKLLSVLTREHGDEYNLVFLYWYEDAYKKNYYCQYRKTFFRYHLADPKFFAYYQAAYRKSTGGTATKEMLVATAAALNADCSGDPAQADLAEDTIMEVDSGLAALIVQDEGTWNFGIDPCAVAKSYDMGRETDAKVGACPGQTQHPTMLERAIGLEWERSGDQRR